MTTIDDYGYVMPDRPLTDAQKQERDASNRFRAIFWRWFFAALVLGIVGIAWACGGGCAQ